MKETESQTESLLEIIRGVDTKAIMLPEFQRDFRWELEQTYDLFDSLIREIFIGTIIYGKPSFGMTLREIDRRPRKGKGSNASLKTTDYSGEQISALAQSRHLRIVLDGQQRITSLYRAIGGLDTVYIILRQGLDPGTVSQLSLEEMVDEVVGEESSTAISVKIADAYQAEVEILEDKDLNLLFQASKYAQVNLLADDGHRKAHERVYRRAIKMLQDLFKKQKMVAFYLLDMSLDKFCLFFERSNSRGIQLDFTDILAAKLYHGFNLRQKIEEFESQSKFKLNREIIVRAIAYIVATEGNKPVKIDRKFILENLDAANFNSHWDVVCKMYTECLQYLANQHYILAQDWMPSENMLIPLMMFLRHVGGFDKMTQEQRTFVEYWYWASVFSNRYSSASNEAIILDCATLLQVARGERIAARGYFVRLRPLIKEATDLFSYNKKSSAIYRGILNLLNYAAQGLRDWNNTQKIDVSMRLEDHHIYPRAYVANATFADIDRDEANQLVDCVANRTLIPKFRNLSVGKKAPNTYLAELQQQSNPLLEECLPSHLIPEGMVSDNTWNVHFRLFLEERAERISALVEKYTMEPVTAMSTRYASQSESNDTSTIPLKPRLRDLIASGKVQIGERLYTRKQPNEFAVIVDGDYVDYNGQRMLINTWGQKMTGWSSISIYDSMLLERTGKPLKVLRDTDST